MYKIDLHTHSIVSPDGSIGERDYAKALEMLDYIAITDHNEISFAEKLQKKFGEKIIVGEEISTQQGEVIGLFLTTRILPDLSIKETIDAIHKQGGLVYIPHPFDSLRSGIGESAILENLQGIDFLEGFNARLVLKWQNTKAIRFATMHQVPVGIGSDAHNTEGLGFAYAEVEQPFCKDDAISLLKQANHIMRYQPWSAFFAPKINRLRKKIFK